MFSNTTPVSIRLTKSEQQKYEAQAINSELSLSTYLRQKLEYNDRLLEEITSLRRTISQLTEVNYEHEDSAMMIELLLLLRQIAQPKHMQLAHGELKRLGLNPWSNLT